jgi:atypical dual specificity phosphatase
MDSRESHGPGPRCYWLVPDLLMGGEWPVPHLDWLERQGVAVLINLTERPYQDPRFTIYEIPVRDGGAPGEREIARFCRLVDRELDAGRKVYAHCLAGCGRTGTMMACYLVYRFRSEPGPAIARVRELRSGSIETAAQADAVAQWRLCMQASEHRLSER